MTDRLTTKKLTDWLRPQITSGARVVAGRLPDTPNRVIGIVMGTGPGLDMEGLFDIVTFQVSCRGAEQNLDDAETMAMEVDDILIGRSVDPLYSSENFVIASESEDVMDLGVYVSQMGRTGGSPSQLTLPDSQSRFTFTCSYFANVSTNIGQVFNG